MVNEFYKNINRYIHSFLRHSHLFIVFACIFIFHYEKKKWKKSEKKIEVVKEDCVGFLILYSSSILKRDLFVVESCKQKQSM